MNHPPASTSVAFDLLAALKRRYKLVGMDISKMLAELNDEKARLEELILAAERYARGQGRRRGRPPAWMKEGSKNKKAPDA